MATTSLRLSNVQDSTGKSQIIVKLNMRRNMRPCFKSGVYINPKNYDKNKNTVIIPKKGTFNLSEVNEAKDTKKQLDDFIVRLTTISNLIENNEPENYNKERISEIMILINGISLNGLTYPMLINEIKHIKEQEKAISHESRPLTELFNNFVEHRKPSISTSRYRGYQVLARILARYVCFVRENDKSRPNFELDINTVDDTDLVDFVEYLRNEDKIFEKYQEFYEKLFEDYPPEISPKHTTKKIHSKSRNTVIRNMKMLRAFYNWLLKENYTTNNPFLSYKIDVEKYCVPFYLTLEELNAIENADFSDNKELEIQRDIFMFQSVIGCRVSDLLSFTTSNIVNEAIEYIPKKTKNSKEEYYRLVRVPLSDRANRIIEKYSFIDQDEHLLPFISEAKYNDAIRRILTKCEITRPVTVINHKTDQEEHRPLCEVASSHLARRNFIGNLYKIVSDPNLIGSMTGHAEGSRAFARYRAIDDNMKKNLVDNLN